MVRSTGELVLLAFLFAGKIQLTLQAGNSLFNMNELHKIRKCHPKEALCSLVPLITCFLMALWWLQTKLDARFYPHFCLLLFRRPHVKKCEFLKANTDTDILLSLFVFVFGRPLHLKDCSQAGLVEFKTPGMAAIRFQRECLETWSDPPASIPSTPSSPSPLILNHSTGAV